MTLRENSDGGFSIIRRIIDSDGELFGDAQLEFDLTVFILGLERTLEAQDSECL